MFIDNRLAEGARYFNFIDPQMYHSHRRLQGILDALCERIGCERLEVRFIIFGPLLEKISFMAVFPQEKQIGVRLDKLDLFSDEEFEAAFAHEIGHFMIYGKENNQHLSAAKKLEQEKEADAFGTRYCGKEMSIAVLSKVMAIVFKEARECIEKASEETQERLAALIRL